MQCWLGLGRRCYREPALGPILGRADVDSQHTETARTTTGTTAAAEATTTTARKVIDRAQIARVYASQMRDLPTSPRLPTYLAAVQPQ
jgi:hypothetical protein